MLPFRALSAGLVLLGVLDQFVDGFFKLLVVDALETG